MNTEVHDSVAGVAGAVATARGPRDTRGARILVVDDDPSILRAVRTNLAAHGYDVQTAETGGDALETFERVRPDVVILDLGLPDQDGAAVIARIRAYSETPIVILSARSDERAKVRALDQGADDYLTKPFGLGELLARVRVALRHVARPASGSDAVLKAGDVEMHLEARRVLVRGAEVHLRPTEYELLKVFLTHPDRVLTHRWLLQRVWGAEYGDEGNYLHVYVAGLRKKLEANPKRPAILLTEAGVGYRLHSATDA